MCSLMMNSIRASPTPSHGNIEVLKASSGLPRLTMISVAGLTSVLKSLVSTRKRSLPA